MVLPEGKIFPPVSMPKIGGYYDPAAADPPVFSAKTEEVINGKRNRILDWKSKVWREDWKPGTRVDPPYKQLNYERI